jgi:tetratricopeptide (TPR) repeat protein
MLTLIKKGNTLANSYNYTEVALNYGKYTEAVQYYDAALSIDPIAVDILGNLE